MDSLFYSVFFIALGAVLIAAGTGIVDVIVLAFSDAGVIVRMNESDRAEEDCWAAWNVNLAPEHVEAAMRGVEARQEFPRSIECNEATDQARDPAALDRIETEARRRWVALTETVGLLTAGGRIA
jgi:hypothetical protein